MAKVDLIVKNGTVVTPTSAAPLRFRAFCGIAHATSPFDVVSCPRSICRRRRATSRGPLPRRMLYE